MKSHRRTSSAALAAAFAALAAAPAYGQTTYNWLGGNATNGNFSSAGNFNSNPASGENYLQFGSSALVSPFRTTANNTAAGFGVNRIIFASTAVNSFTISGSQIEMKGTNPSLLQNSSFDHVISAPLKLGSNATFGGTGTGTVTLTGEMEAGGKALTKSGDSTFVLGSIKSGDKFSTVTLSGGVLALGANGGLGANNDSSLSISFTGGTLRYNSGVTTDYSARIAATAGQNRRIDIVNGHTVTFASALGTTSSLTKLGGGTLILSGNNSYSGGTTLSGGYVQLGSANAIGTSGTINFAGGGLRATSSNTTDYSARFATTAGQQYNIDTNGQSVTWATNLQSTGGSLTKNGTGTLTLTGNNTYSGATNVNAGTLTFGSATALSANTELVIANGASVNFFNNTIPTGKSVTVNGNLSGDLVVASGATFSGTNTITGNRIVNGTISPGNSPGAQNIVGNETWNGGGEYDWEILDATGVAGTGYDTVTVTGTLDLSGLSPISKFIINVISLTSIGPDVPGDANNFDETGSFAWTLATAGTINGFNANHFDLNLGGFTNSYAGSFSLGVVDNITNQQLVLLYSAIPEPSSAALLFGAGALVAVGSRRRRVRA